MGEQFDKKFAKEDIVQKVRIEFEQMKKENLEKKARGEKYEPHFNDLLPEKIGEEEAYLWDELKRIKFQKELDGLIEKFNDCKEKITQKVIARMKIEEGGEFDLNKFFSTPEQAFLGFLGNQMQMKRLEFYKKIKK